MTATPQGSFSTFTVDVMLFAAGLITETVLLYSFATYMFVPSGLTVTPKGLYPTDTVAVTVLVAVSITDTLLLPEFVIYTNGVPPAILISIKIIAVEAKAIEHNFCLVIMH